MLIDAKHRALDALFIFGFGVFVMGLGIGGAFGPRPEIQISSSRIIHNRLLKPPLTVKLEVAKMNSYVYADVQFVCKTYKHLVYQPLFLNFSGVFSAGGSVVRRVRQSGLRVVPEYAPELTKVTNPVRLFFDDVIRYDEIEYNLSYDPGMIPHNVEYIVSTQYRGTPTFAVVQMIMRILLSVICGSVFTMFRLSMKGQILKTEQLLTAVLVLLSIFDANALCYSISLFVPSYFFVMWNAVFSASFGGYFRVYLIAIFDALRSDDILGRQALKYLIYSLAHSVVRIYHELTPDAKLIDYESEAVTNHSVLFFLERWSDQLFITWLVCSIIYSAISPRLKYPRRLWMYLGLGAVYLFWHGADVGLCRVHVMLAEGSTHAAMTLAWRACVPLMCLFFFWPAPAPPEPLQLHSSSSYLRHLGSG
jgi:hypothetical protein